MGGYKSYEIDFELFDKLRTLQENDINRAAFVDKLAASDVDLVAFNHIDPNAGDDDYVTSYIYGVTLSGIKRLAALLHKKRHRFAADYLTNPVKLGTGSIYTHFDYIVQEAGTWADFIAPLASAKSRNSVVIIRLTGNITSAALSATGLQLPIGTSLIVDLAGFTLTVAASGALANLFRLNNCGNFLAVFGGTIKLGVSFAGADFSLYSINMTTSAVDFAAAEPMSMFCPFDILGISVAANKKLTINMDSIAADVFVALNCQQSTMFMNPNYIGVSNAGAGTFNISSASKVTSGVVVMAGAAAALLDNTYRYQMTAQIIPTNLLYTL